MKKSQPQRSESREQAMIDGTISPWPTGAASSEPKRAFGNCENCGKQHCAIWFVGSKLLCKKCRDAASPASGVASSHAPEDCKLVAHNTGDGWYLGVKDRNGDDIAMLRWPWGDKGKTAKQLEEYGYEIV